MNEIGPYIICSSEEGEFEPAIEAAFKKIVAAQGIPLNEDVCALIKNIAEEKAESIKHEVRAQGFPNEIQKLFAATKKNIASQIAKNLIITKNDIARMVSNCDLIGYKHSRYHKFFYPEDVIPTELEKSSFSAISKVGPIMDPNAQRFVKKMFDQIKKRKYISGHLFEKNEEWHIIYFDFNDAYEMQGANHYKGGPHIHYTSHLWGDKVDKSRVWDELQNRLTKIPSIHIKFKEDD